MKDDREIVVPLRPTPPTEEPPTAVAVFYGTAAFVLICCAPAIIIAVWRWAL